MSDEYSAVYLIMTSFFPQILLGVFIPSLLVGVSLRFFKDPARNI